MTCSWDHPGADRYTGQVSAAIASYGFPLATQQALVEAWEKRRFTDTVVIDRESIRGRTYDYDPEIRAMHFGSSGRVCATVTRTGWDALHVESAVVLCADNECVGLPALCLNVFRITRRAAPAVAPSSFSDGAVPGTDTGDTSAPIAAFEAPSAGTEEVTSGAPFSIPAFGAASLGAVWCPPAILSPIPEPSTLALIAGGLVAIALRRRV